MLVFERGSGPFSRTMPNGLITWKFTSPNLAVPNSIFIKLFVGLGYKERGIVSSTSLVDTTPSISNDPSSSVQPLSSVTVTS